MLSDFTAERLERGMTKIGEGLAAIGSAIGSFSSTAAHAVMIWEEHERCKRVEGAFKWPRFDQKIRLDKEGKPYG